MRLNGRLPSRATRRDPEMNLLSRILPRLWIVAPLGACAFLAWSTHVRVERIEYVSGLAGAAGAPDPRSATGYANGQRELIIPERLEDSFHWIAETQQMLGSGELRVRHVDYENPPAGHEVSWASPYRWWLGIVAGVDHALSGRPVGMSVERAAIYADPLLLALFILGASALAAWRLGGFAAGLLGVGLVGLFPFAARFLPGMPDQAGLALGLALGSLLAILAGALAGQNPRPWMIAAGILGGLTLWVSVSTGVPIVLGVAIGAMLAAFVPGAAPLPWRTWSRVGGWTVFAAYLAEYFPDHMASWNVGRIHPLYGLAWIGLGELVSRCVSRIQGDRRPWILRDYFMAAFAAAMLASVPLAMWKTGSPGFLARDLEWARLAGLPHSPVAAGTGAWLKHDGMTPTAWATLLPVVSLAAVAFLVFRGGAPARSRAAIAVAAGPAVVALGFALRQLGWWAGFDACLLAVIAAASAGAGALPALTRGLLVAAALVFAVPGIARLLPEKFVGASTVLTPAESEELVERHLAHWLSQRTGERAVVVYAPPNETTTLCFFGGLRGIGSFAPDNSVGFGNTLAIAGARTMEEVQDDLHARGVRYIVIPSWDPFFEEFARLYLVKELAGRTSLLIGELRRWNLPLWLQAVPYQIPVGGGFEGQSVLVFEVVDPQAPAAAAGRLAEYLVEMGKLDDAAAVAERLRRFPGDVGALAAEAQVQSARGDAQGAGQTLTSLLARLSAGGDRFLPWDRRVSLAVVLVQGQRYDLAKEQVRRCMADANEARLRSLSAGSLYDLLVLAHSFGVDFADPSLRILAPDLLPGDLRNRL
jgi:hypothetical protein